MNGMIQSYEDFVIRFEKNGGNTYPVSVSCSRGEVRGTFKIPFGEEELSHWRADFHAAVPTGSPIWKKRGRILFDALFRKEVLTLYRRALDHVENRPESGIRIKLFLEPSHPNLAWLGALPWELLYDPARHVFPALSRRTPLVRHLSLAKVIPNMVVKPPLRVLLAEYRDAPGGDLFLKKEHRLIEKILAKHDDILVDTLPEVSRKSLRRQLSRKEYHILHFMGHGGFEGEPSAGFLWFGSSEDEAEKVFGEDLAATLQDFPTLKLAFLAACSSGRTSTVGISDPFTGVGSALVAGGLPAVIAMQYPIYNETAASFSEWLYAGIARGESVEQAVTAGRQALEADYPQHPDWLCPILYLRASSGMLLKPKRPNISVVQSKKKRALAELLGGIKGKPLGRYPSGENHTSSDSGSAPAQVHTENGPRSSKHSLEQNLAVLESEKNDTDDSGNWFNRESWEILTDRVRRGDCIPILGPDLFFSEEGIRRVSLDRQWQEFLATKLSPGTVEIEGPDRNGKLASALAKEFGGERLLAEATGFFDGSSRLEDAHLADLANLPIRDFVTTSFGLELEKVIQDQRGQACITEWFDFHHPHVRHKGKLGGQDSYLVFHAWGCIRDPRSLPLTGTSQMDFAAVLKNCEEALAFRLGNRFRSKKVSLLFLGFPLQRGKFRSWMWSLCRAGEAGPVFAVEDPHEPIDPHSREMFSQELDIHFLHRDLRLFLRELRWDVENRTGPHGG